MAVKSNVGRLGGGLKVGKPVISTDVMGNRNIEVRAVGAWVQPEAEMTGYEYQHGVISARQEENRLLQNQQEKEARLRKFQDEVRKRVKALDHLKKQKMIEKSVKEIEIERQIVRQSAFAKGRSTSRKDNCSLHKQLNLAIHSPNASKTDGVHQKTRLQDTAVPVFSDQKQQTRIVVQQARKNLVSKQLLTDSPDMDGIANRRSQVIRHKEDLDEDKSKMGVAPEMSSSDQSGVSSRVEKLQLEDRTNVKNVHFDLRPWSQDSRKDVKSQPNSGKPLLGCKVISKVPEIYKGVLSQDEKRRKQVQHAMYRRLFMDIEREQVKENLRQKEHRKRMARLKKEKEESRKEEEQEARYLVEPRDPVTGETQEETADREYLEHVHITQAMKEQQARLQKAKEMERYVEALKYRLRGRIEERDIQLPPLCCCGESIWDTNPDTCANNCVFYKNPKGYAKALQSLLSSFDVL